MKVTPEDSKGRKGTKRSRRSNSRPPRRGVRCNAKSCRFFELRQQLAPEMEWPMDSNGQCILHSIDREWKIGNRWRASFLQLLQKWDAAIRQSQITDSFLDFSGCVFAGEPQEELPGEGFYIDFSGLSVGEHLILRGSRFLDTVWFSHSTFHKSVDFSYCSFAFDADFGNSAFHRRLVLDHATAKGAILFREARFQRAATFEEILAESLVFNACAFDSYASLKGAQLSSMHFEGCECRRDMNRAMVNFESLEAQLFRVVDTRFQSEVSCEGMAITRGEWIGVTTPPDLCINLSRIRVYGLFQLKGRSSSERLFQHAVSLHLEATDSVRGSITFENANVFHLDLNDVSKSLMEARPPRIVFGPGCNSFRLHREFVVPASPQHESLLHEMAQTFVSFFNYSKGHRLRLCVDCEFEPGSVVVRYHADADMTEDEFLAVLEETAPEFYEYLTNPDRFLAAALEARDIPHVDICRRVWSLVTGVVAVARLTSSWGIEQTGRLLRVISPSLERRQLPYHTFILNIAIQSPGAKQIASGRDTAIRKVEDER